MAMTSSFRLLTKQWMTLPDKGTSQSSPAQSPEILYCVCRWDQIRRPFVKGGGGKISGFTPRFPPLKGLKFVRLCDGFLCVDGLWFSVSLSLCIDGRVWGRSEKIRRLPRSGFGWRRSTFCSIIHNLESGSWLNWALREKSCVKGDY